MMLGKGRRQGLGALCASCAAASATIVVEAAAPEDSVRRILNRQNVRGPVSGQAPLTLADATARAIKYQSEHRQGALEEALAEAQSDVAQFDLLPKLMANGRLQPAPTHEAFASLYPRAPSDGRQSASVERTHRTGSLGRSWKPARLSDVAYSRTKQLADQKLIAGKKSAGRKAWQYADAHVRVPVARESASPCCRPPTSCSRKSSSAIDKTRTSRRASSCRRLQTATLRPPLLDSTSRCASARQTSLNRASSSGAINARAGKPVHGRLRRQARERESPSSPRTRQS